MASDEEGTTKADPAMKGYIEKVDALMEGDGGPLTVVAACKGKTLQDGIDFYKSPAYQELVKLRAPYTDWDFRLVQGRF